LVLKSEGHKRATGGGKIMFKKKEVNGMPLSFVNEDSVNALEEKEAGGGKAMRGGTSAGWSKEGGEEYRFL